MAAISGELERVVQEVLAPLIEADGGELYVVRIADPEVELHLTGRFSGCAGNELVVQRVIQPLLQTVTRDVRVKVSSGPILPPTAVRVSGSHNPHQK